MTAKVFFELFFELCLFSFFPPFFFFFTTWSQFRSLPTKPNNSKNEQWSYWDKRLWFKPFDKVKTNKISKQKDTGMTTPSNWARLKQLPGEISVCRFIGSLDDLGRFFSNAETDRVLGRLNLREKDEKPRCFWDCWAGRVGRETAWRLRHVHTELGIGRQWPYGLYRFSFVSWLFVDVSLTKISSPWLPSSVCGKSKYSLWSPCYLQVKYFVKWT